MDIPRNPRRAQGVTLVELLIVIMLLGILGVVGSSMISDSFKVSHQVSGNNAAEAAGRYALERIARELREVSYDATTSSYSSLRAADGSAFIANAVSDLSFCRNIGGTPTTVSLRWDRASSNLYMDYANCPTPLATPPLPLPGKVLISQVTGFQLGFYTASRTPAAVAAIQSATVFVAIEDRKSVV